MKLQTKLIIAFSSIVLLMAFFQTSFFQNRVEKDFTDYIRQNESENIANLKDILIDYYDNNGSWDNIQDQLSNPMMDIRPRRGRMGGNNFMFPKMYGLQFIVVNEEGTVVADTESTWIGKQSDKIPGMHEALMSNEDKIGELIIYQKAMGIYNVEQQFMQSVKTSIIFGSLITVIIAVLLSIFLSNKVTKPLEKLMLGIRRLAKGDTSYRVEVSTNDEFSQLAKAFNEMSSKLEQNEEVRKTLVADVAHELRTPLSVLRGRLESIQEGAIHPTQEVIIQLNDEVYRLSRLVNDLQQLSLAEAGKLPLKKLNTEMNELIYKIIENFKWLADEKNITITTNLEENLKAFIDKDRITQVIINLIGNALRHTPEYGKLDIDLLKYKDNELEIRIADSGPGIEEEFLPFIFERFYRTDTSRSRDQGGTGLGLSIAKGYVLAHNGSISVKSNKKEGTTFIIHLPLQDI